MDFISTFTDVRYPRGLEHVINVLSLSISIFSDKSFLRLTFWQCMDGFSGYLD